jgi:hypothetical protein
MSKCLSNELSVLNQCFKCPLDSNVKPNILLPVSETDPPKMQCNYIPSKSYDMIGNTTSYTCPTGTNLLYLNSDNYCVQIVSLK